MDNRKQERTPQDKRGKSSDVFSMMWIRTPRTCPECKYYNHAHKDCGLKVCRYPARR